MAAGTALSRITGLARTVAVASALGVTAVGDAYNTANTAPNMLFQLAVGGVLSASVVPLLVREEDRRRRDEAASALLTMALVVGVAAAVALVLLAPFVIELLTSGAAQRSDRAQLVELGTRWLRIFAPQIPLYALSVVAVGILSSKRRLALGALAPVATNLMVIAGALAFASIGAKPALSSVTSSQVALLGWATTGGVGVMAAVQLWGARRSHQGLRLRFALRDPVVAKVGRLGRWVLLYVGVNQVGLAVVIGLASSVRGGVSAYQWAFTIMQLPYALIAVSIYSAAYPLMAQAASAPARLSAQVSQAAEHSLVLLFPAAAGMALLSRPLAVALVGAEGAELVSAGLRGFAASLLPFAMFQL
ncbi:MAG: lipid II flippase MurJ, partial [Acidimicrobiales bacterium]